MAENGVFITFEGGEGSGKSTLLQTLKQHYEDKGFPVLVTREPGGCELAEQIRHLLLSAPAMVSETELFLFAAARAQHVQEVIKPSLGKGFVVLCDRFNDSTIVYQGVARSIDPQVVEDVCAIASGGLIPKQTFLLDLDPEIGFNRIRELRSKDRIEQETINFHKKVREGYLQQAKKYPERFTVLDASQSKEVVRQEALNSLKEILL